MKTSYHPSLPFNARAQRRKDKPTTPDATPLLSAPWRLGGLALNSVRAAGFVAIVTLFPSIAQAQAIEAWVQRYDGPGNGEHLFSGMVVDTNGNVYVAGWCESAEVSYQNGWATLKYSSAGVPLWTNSYYGIEGCALQGFGTRPNAVAVDALGNVYVTGNSDDPRQNPIGHYCTTLKYSSAGVPLWTNVYATSDSFGSALGVDASGNVVIVGTVSGSSDDYLTIKYSSAGVLLWAKQYNGPANGRDYASAVALDANGDVYVTGTADLGGSLSGYATIKYSSAGVPLWTNLCSRRYGGAWGMALDSSGNVVVTGCSQLDTITFNDFLTVKYSSAGVPLWTNRYDGPVNGGDKAWAVAVNASGNVIVTGGSDGSGYATIMYSSAGMPLWTNFYNGQGNGGDDARAVAVDASGNVYVTGMSPGSGGSLDYATVAYSSSGMPLWTNRYNGPGNGNDWARAVAVDANGGIYVAGASQDSDGHYDIALVKYVVPPIITRQPLSCTNAVGTTASFSVEAAGNVPLSYQWRREGTNLVNGPNLSGVTTTNLQIANVQLADAASYTVVVTNAYGSSTSSVAQLTVYVPPNPGRFTHLSYSPATGFSFIFRDATVGKPYRIQTSTSLAQDTWTDWMSFNYTVPILLTDMEAVGTTNTFYRATSP